jgi:hypothetical protein
MSTRYSAKVWLYQVPRFVKRIVRMLIVNQRHAFEGLAGLKHLR